MPISDEPSYEGMTVVNVDAAEAWNGPDGDFWTEHEDQHNRAIGGYNAPLFQGACISATDRVLDVGCGCGVTTRGAARRATSGTALGVDLSARMIQRARERSHQENLTNVSFQQADAQVYPFKEHAFDVAISRFGIMFFNDPVAAFTNIGWALRPGGRVALLAWHEYRKNEWMLALHDALAVGRSLPDPLPGVPGPFAFADPSLVRHILTEAGFAGVNFEEVNGSHYLGAGADDAFSFARTMGVTRGLLKDLDDRDKVRALDELRRTLNAHVTGEGVLFPSCAWLITAHRE